MPGSFIYCEPIQTEPFQSLVLPESPQLIDLIDFPLSESFWVKIKSYHLPRETPVAADSRTAIIVPS